METLTRDLRYALRSLSRSPLFVAVAALTLAFGIGVNATIFTFVNAILLRPLPVESPDELLAVFTSLPGQTYTTSSYADYLDLREQNDVFSGLAGHSTAAATFQHEGRSDVLIGELVTGNYFEVIGVRAARGRTILPGDDVGPGSPRVVVLGHGLWQRRFGGDPEIPGRTVRFSGESYEVVGVAPESFPGLVPGFVSDYWISTSQAEEIEPVGWTNKVHNDPGRTMFDRRGHRWMSLKGRLRTGVDPARAEAQLATVMARLAQEHAVTNDEAGLATVPASQVRVHPDIDRVLGPALAVLLGAVGLVLLITCANLANMLLSRAQGRRREIAVRLALGASRGRLVRQLLSESLLLSALGGVLALVVAHWTTHLLLAFQLPIPFSLNLDMAMDGRVVVFTALLAFGAAVLFGLVPALQATRPDLVPALREGSNASSGSARFFTLKNALVMVQVAVSLVLLVAGSLLGRGLSAAQEIDVGFDAGQVAVQPIYLDMHGYEAEKADVFFRTLQGRVAALPGVETVAVATRLPLDPKLDNQRIYPVVPGLDTEDSGFNVDVTRVGSDYFATLGAPLLLGRSFNAGDLYGGPRVAIVNEAMARRFWNDVDVIGERLYASGVDTEPYEIVGVVADYKVRTVGEEPRAMVHYASSQRQVRNAYLLARSAGDAGLLAEAMRRTALEMDPQLTFAEMTTLGDLVKISLYPVRMGAALLGVFGLLALLLACIGLYGVIAYSVAQRDREIGVRVAMGARPRDVVGLVLRGGMGLVLVGLVAGLALAAGLSRFVSGLLYGLSAVDPIAFAGAALVLVAVAFVANFVPAARAARLDPLAALRQE